MRQKITQITFGNREPKHIRLKRLPSDPVFPGKPTAQANMHEWHYAIHYPTTRPQGALPEKVVM
jgi:hypothetical protein